MIASPAAAGPDLCQRSDSGGDVAVTCTGDQSAGLRNGDLINSRPAGAASAPALPANLNTLTWNVRNLSADITPARLAAGIQALLGSGTGTEVAGIPAAQLDLDVDLGGRRIHTVKHGRVHGIDILHHTGNIDLSFRNGTIEAASPYSAVHLQARKGSISARLGGTLRAGATSNGLIAAFSGFSTLDQSGTGNVGVTIAPGSTLTAGGPVPYAKGSTLTPVLIDARAETGSVAVTLEAGSRATSLPTASLFAMAAILGRTHVQTARVAPGGVTVTLAGNARDAKGNALAGATVSVQTDGVAGVGAQALSAPGLVRDTGTVRVTTGAGSSILTTGASSPGLFAESIGKNIDVTVAGSIATHGGIHKNPSLAPVVRESAGVVALTAKARNVIVSVERVGLVATRGAGSDAIRALTEVAITPNRLPPPSTLDVDVAGTLRTAGDGAAGIRARASYGKSDISVTVGEAGRVSTRGGTLRSDGRRVQAHAVDAFNVRGDIAIEVAGSADTTGLRAGGIVAEAAGGTARVTLAKTGEVTTSEAEGKGILARGKSTTAVTAAGEIRTRGPDAVGIEAIGSDGEVVVTVAGRLTTTGLRGHGVVARSSRNTRDSESADAVQVNVSGTIEAAGSGAVGLQVATLAGQPITLTIRAGGSVWAETAVLLTGGGNTPTAHNSITIEAGGDLTGSLTTGAGSDFVTNSGTLSVRRAARFGGGINSLVHRGVLHPGGANRVESVDFAALDTAAFLFGSTLVLDVDGIAGEADQVTFTGNRRIILSGGSIRVNPMRAPNRAGERRFTVVKTDGQFGGSAGFRLFPPPAPLVEGLRTSYRLEQQNNQLILVQLTQRLPATGSGRVNTHPLGTELARLVAPSTLSLSGKLQGPGIVR